MTQMIPVNNNPFSAFDVPQFAKQAVAPLNLSHAQKPDSVEIKSAQPQNNSDVGQSESKNSFINKIKNINPKILAFGAAVAAVALGATAFAVKRKKTNATDAARTLASLAKNTNDIQVGLAGSSAAVAKSAENVLVDVTEDIKDAAADVAAKAASEKKSGGEANLVLAAFGIGLFARAFREFRESDDIKAIELKKQLLESEPYIKRVEIPYITREAQESYNSFANEVADILEVTKKPYSTMKQLYISSLKTYENLKDGSYSEFYDNSDVKKREVTRDESGSTTLKNFGKDGKLFSVVHFSNKGAPRDIILYKDEKMRAKAEYKTSIDTDSPYISRLFVYANSSGLAHTVSYDENSNPKSYLARTQFGKFLKCYNINGATGELKSVFLPASGSGGKCAKKYFYKPDGELDKVVIMPSNDLPLRSYNYEDGVLMGLDLFNSENEAPILHVPFEKLNQSEFIEK